MEEQKLQKVKLSGPLWTTRQFLGLVKEALVVILLLVLIWGVISVVKVLGNIKLPW